MSELLQQLNEKQYAAVCAPHAHRLVLAGAGSGKTRVLVHRMTWLMQEQQVSPYAILAVTFTNKAAAQMRSRIEDLNGQPATGLWVGTFHSIAHRMLRLHHTEAGLPEGFQILDSDDQYRLVRRVMKSLDIDETKFPPKQAQWFINKCKEDGQRPKTVASDDYFADVMNRIYTAYTAVCERSGLVDFAELLLRVLELLQKDSTIREHYQQRFLHILVDEFQDTNTIQYRWLCILCGDNTAVMAVGDDDQSIYSWRGAKIENLHRFQRDFANCDLIRLEQNYRSTQNILDAANAVIAQNDDRLGKELWTNGSSGEPITVYAAFNEHDEAHYIADSISQAVRQDMQYSDMAILYRSNAQSRVLEESLLKKQIPYRIYGGQKFFERAEIKDALAYLRLIANRNDDAAFERVVNFPTRGIGNASLDTLRQVARDTSLSLWMAAEYCCNNAVLPARATTAIKAFLALIAGLDDHTTKDDLGEQTQFVLESSGLLAHYKKDKTEKGLSRVENLEELISATSQYRMEEEAVEHSFLASFLAHVALESGESQADAYANSVSLMTLHAAKGLEFPVVFLAGLEEDLFPHKMSTKEPHGLAEERRLCYVGMTRAMRKLTLCYAEARRLYGVDQSHAPSRFINEIPEELLYRVRPKAQVRPLSNQSWSQAASTSGSHRRQSLKGHAIESAGLSVGQRVMHKKFGDGTVVNYEGSGSHTRIQVNFDHAGAKWLVASFAKLVPL